MESVKSGSKKISFGRFVISDQRICHGKLIFKGTRILVDDVLEMVAEGLSWDHIIEQWHDEISKEAISEAVTLSKESLARGELVS